MRRRKKYQFYGPAHFRATWAKFLDICERDRVSASHLIRVWVEGYIQHKDQEKPQRPLTDYMPGHDDKLGLNLPEILSKLEEYASLQNKGLSWLMISDELKPYLQGAARIRAADRISQKLEKRGIKVWR